jgi:hypothetical protein
MSTNGKSRGMGDNSIKQKPIILGDYKSGYDLFKAAYKQMRVCLQIVHNRLHFLNDNINKARNGDTDIDKYEGIFEAVKEIKFIRQHTEKLQPTYHALEYCKTLNEENNALENIADAKYLGHAVANAESKIMEHKELYEDDEEVLKEYGVEVPKVVHDE